MDLVGFELRVPSRCPSDNRVVLFRVVQLSITSAWTDCVSSRVPTAFQFFCSLKLHYPTTPIQSPVPPPPHSSVPRAQLFFLTFARCRRASRAWSCRRNRVPTWINPRGQVVESPDASLRSPIRSIRQVEHPRESARRTRLRTTRMRGRKHSRMRKTPRLRLQTAATSQMKKRCANRGKRTSQDRMRSLCPRRPR